MRFSRVGEGSEDNVFRLRSRVQKGRRKPKETANVGTFFDHRRDPAGNCLINQIYCDFIAFRFQTEVQRVTFADSG